MSAIVAIFFLRLVILPILDLHHSMPDSKLEVGKYVFMLPLPKNM